MNKKFYLQDTADDTMAGPFYTEAEAVRYQEEQTAWQGETVSVFSSEKDIDVSNGE